MSKQQGIFYAIMFATLMNISVAFAEAPVENIYNGGSNNVAPQQTVDALPSTQANVNDGAQQPLVTPENENNEAAIFGDNNRPQDMTSSAAPVPNVAASPTPAQPAVTVDNSNLTNEQRLAKLENQLANLQQLNVVTQLNAMQKQLQDVQGRLDVDAHELKVLQVQQRDIYQDLNRGGR